MSGNHEVQIQAPTLLGAPGRTVITARRCPCGKPCTVLNVGGEKLASMKACSTSYLPLFASIDGKSPSNPLAEMRFIGG